MSLDKAYAYDKVSEGIGSRGAGAVCPASVTAANEAPAKKAALIARSSSCVALNAPAPARESSLAVQRGRASKHPAVASQTAQPVCSPDATPAAQRTPCFYR